MSETTVKDELDYNQYYKTIQAYIANPDIVKHYLKLIYLQGKLDGIIEANKRR